MKLYSYRGEDGECAPLYTTHVIIEENVKTIKKYSFSNCRCLVSITMGDGVISIEYGAFFACTSLKFLRLSRKLEYIGARALSNCISLKAIFLPSTMKRIDGWAFAGCRRLQVFGIGSSSIKISHMGKGIVQNCEKLLIPSIVQYELDMLNSITEESNKTVNDWLLHRYDYLPFYKLCHDPSISQPVISKFISKHGNECARERNNDGKTPLHILAMNPHTPPGAFLTCFKANESASIALDCDNLNSIDYAMKYNVDCLFDFITALSWTKVGQDLGGDWNNHLKYV